MPERLEILSANLDFNVDDDQPVTVGAYVVFDNLSGIPRWASLSMASCERWIDNHRYEYPEPEEDDDLS